jgi:hypothetical protein
MKKALFILPLSFILAVNAVNESFAFKDLEQMKRELEIMKKQAILEYNYQKMRREEAEQLKQQVNSCSLLNEEYASGIASEVVRGRYITAFEMCRKEEKSVDVCIQKIKEIKEKWKAKCQDVESKALIDYYYARAMDTVNNVLNYLQQTKARALGSLRDGYGYGSVAGAALSGASQAIAQMYPGSQFSLLTGTGKIVMDAGEIYFQGWNFVQFDMRAEGGLIMQVFPNKINFVNNKYNIAFYFEPDKKEWEVVEVNLPFDAQTEKLLMSLGQGVRVLDKEIIFMMNDFLHNTTFGLDLYVTSKELLLRNESRRLLMENLFEYFAYDTYIKKVVAGEAKQKQQGGGQQGGKTRKKK